MTDDKIPTSGVREEDIPASYAACVESMNETFEEWQDAHEVMEQSTGTVLGGVVGALAGGGTGAILGALVGGPALRATDFFDQAADNVESMRDHAIQENCDSILNSVDENESQSSDSQDVRDGESPAESAQDVVEPNPENIDHFDSELNESPVGGDLEQPSPVDFEPEGHSQEAQSADELTTDTDPMGASSSVSDLLESSAISANEVEGMCDMPDLEDIAPDYGPPMPDSLNSMQSGSDTSGLMSELPSPNDLAPDYGPPMPDSLDPLQSGSDTSGELMSTFSNPDDLAPDHESPVPEDSWGVGESDVMCDVPDPEDIGPDYGPPLPEDIASSDDGAEAGFSSP